MPAGTLARVPPLVVHGFRNGSDADVRYLNFHAPGRASPTTCARCATAARFSYDQYPPPPDGGRPPTEAVVGGDGSVVERPGLRVTLLADVEEIGIAETWSDAGGRRPPPHAHARHVESFYVLDGELTLTAGGRDLGAAAGSWVQVPPGVAHAVGPRGSPCATSTSTRRAAGSAASSAACTRQAPTTSWARRRRRSIRCPRECRRLLRHEPVEAPEVVVDREHVDSGEAGLGCVGADGVGADDGAGRRRVLVEQARRQGSAGR